MAPLIPEFLTSALDRGESVLAEIPVAVFRVNSEDGECNVCRNVGTASKYDGPELGKKHPVKLSAGIF
jgi:hypothetical protein